MTDCFIQIPLETFRRVHKGLLWVNTAQWNDTNANTNGHISVFGCDRIILARSLYQLTIPFRVCCPGSFRLRGLYFSSLTRCIMRCNNRTKPVPLEASTGRVLVRYHVQARGLSDICGEYDQRLCIRYRGMTPADRQDGRHGKCQRAFGFPRSLLCRGGVKYE